MAIAADSAAPGSGALATGAIADARLGDARLGESRAALAAEAILTLFSFDWDQMGVGRLASRYRLHNAGFDLFSFPSNARLLTFDIEHWVERLAQRFGPRRLAGVLSHNEQFGALAAALLAQRLGLPGTPPRAVVMCQHKLLCRDLLQQVAPEANLPYAMLQARYGDAPPADLRYPLFVKPVKAAYSVLARRIEDRQQLRQHIRFGRAETWIIERLVKPFNDVAQRLVPGCPDAHRMIIEQPVQAAQFNLDGWVWRGEVNLLGVCDELMYPGTQAFLRFAYPSRLPAAVQRRAFDVARRFLEGAGFDHGFFNMEFFYDEATDTLRVIEFNPRLASQLADLYHRVDGIDVHAMTLALACGRDPSAVMREPRRGGAAASFVFRCFGGEAAGPAPDAESLAWFHQTFPDALLLRFPKRGAGLRRELKWLGSHRYAVMHLHGDDQADLRRRYRTVCQRFGWPDTW